jgi:hypothetical protein
LFFPGTLHAGTHRQGTALDAGRWTNRPKFGAIPKGQSIEKLQHLPNKIKNRELPNEKNCSNAIYAT